MKEVRIILSPEAEEVYKKLNAEAEKNKIISLVTEKNKIEILSPAFCYSQRISINN